MIAFPPAARVLTPMQMLSTEIPVVPGVTWENAPAEWLTRRTDTFVVLGNAPSTQAMEKTYHRTLAPQVDRAIAAGTPLGSVGMLWGPEWPNMPPVDAQNLISLDGILPYDSPLLWSLKGAKAVYAWRHFLTDALHAIQHADHLRFPDPNAPLTAEALQQHRYYRLGELIFTTDDLFRNVQRLIVRSHMNKTHATGMVAIWNRSIHHAFSPSTLPASASRKKPLPKTEASLVKKEIHGIDWSQAPIHLSTRKVHVPKGMAEEPSSSKRAALYLTRLSNRVRDALLHREAMSSVGLLWGPDWPGMPKPNPEHVISLDALIPDGAPIFEELSEADAIDRWRKFLLDALRAIMAQDPEHFPDPQAPLNSFVFQRHRYYRAGALTFTINDLFRNVHRLILDREGLAPYHYEALSMWNSLLGLSPTPPAKNAVTPQLVVSKMPPKTTPLPKTNEAPSSAIIDKTALIVAASHLADLRGAPPSDPEFQAPLQGRKLSWDETLLLFKEHSAQPTQPLPKALGEE